MNHLFGWRWLASLTFMLLYFDIDVLCASQPTVQSETRQVKGVVGQSLSFPERVNKSGNLLHGDLGSIANVYPGKEGKITLEKRFENRIHLNSVTRYFTLSDLKIDDAGVYTVEDTDGGGKNKFELTVYNVVSKPQVTGCDSSSCRAVCSVDNEKEVTLTSYRGEEILNQTSSPDLTTDLSLYLEVEGKNYNSTYSCVAANPISNETVPVPKCCSKDGHPNDADSDERGRGILIIAVICVSVALGMVGLAIYLKKRRNGQPKDSSQKVQVDIVYATITPKKQADNQEERTGVPELDSLRDKPKLTSVYDTLQSHRMAASGDVDTA
ncbi:SLAM family member 5-like isoform X1 [Salvelinus namaycush]|uniref:SLAM family member 5-like isoform X1 n=1 Tax=Salvelinus namaycush TaxID=8040 RepID=A0A8U0Q846_SALNM|nr:SLAM family member 5-like isoform X1 [Salvelinus namaycush]